MVKFLDLASQYRSIKSDIDAAIESVITDCGFVGGDYVTKFESEFARYVEADFCVGVGNGTDSLEIAIEALRLEPGSEIIVPSNSFIASGEAVTRCGHRVVFADVSPDSYVLCLRDVEARITQRTSAIVAVHLYGHPCDMSGLASLASTYDLRIIEDCAQAHGAKCNGLSVGSIGDVASFSFYPGKNLGAYGDGGAITTNDEELAIRCRMIANHGRLAKYNHEFEGRNSRLDGMQAAILSAKLQHLPQWTARRIAIADRYLRNLKDADGIVLPVRQAWAEQVYHLFVIRTQRRDALREYLQDRGVQTGIHYPVALSKLPAYRYLGAQDEKTFANSSDSQLLSLPIGEHLSDADCDYVCDCILSFLAVSEA